ncbi:hypothetical protein, partial [Microvirga tunisiensis]|uniref:hypothetical protein n=1 Tax=Microvirga tunisiensis TaxID=2108360 RepID=UPI001AED4D21
RGQDLRDRVDYAERNFRRAHGFDRWFRPSVPRSDVIDPIPQHGLPSVSWALLSTLIDEV